MRGQTKLDKREQEENQELTTNKNTIRRKQDKPVQTLETIMRKEKQLPKQMDGNGATNRGGTMFIWSVSGDLRG